MLFFRPNFCANCGEKIERIDWTLWSSRRFCDLCSTDFMFHEYAPRIIVGIALVAIVSSAGAFFSGSSLDGTNGSKGLASQKSTSTVANSAGVKIVEPENVNRVVPEIERSVTAPKTLAAIPPTRPPMVEKTGSTETAYFCGAETKKGTACSRRVKGNNRCYQHLGMPSMLTANKLKIG